MKSCPFCLKKTERLIKESCGHDKCRDCFIKEETGCSACLNGIDDDQNDGEFEPEVTSNLGVVSKGKSIVPSFGSMLNDYCEAEYVAPIVIPIQLSESSLIGEPAKKKPKKKLPDHVIELELGGTVCYKCTICNKIFHSKSQRYYHLYCDEVDKKPFACKICSKRFSSSYHLKYHEESHKASQKLLCPKCSKVFSRTVTLMKHMKSHEKNISFHCPECNVVFKDKYAFKSHSNKHKNIFPFSCKQCEKKFSLKSTFMQHQLVHSNETSYECSHCKKRFKRIGSYRAHFLRHSKTSQHSCDICKKEFSDTRTFRRHKMIHEETGFYKCVFCLGKIKRKDNLSRHLKNMHPSESTGNPNEINTFFVIEEELSNKILNKNGKNLKTETYSADTDKSQKCAQRNELDGDKETPHQCSVIKSVGNVKSVILSRNEPLDNINPSTITKTDEAVTCCNQESSNQKRRRKYDPLEIYRKILFASNDEDSILEDIDKIRDSQGQASEQNQEKSEANIQQNFAEIHWRKRTSQYYSSINT